MHWTNTMPLGGWCAAALMKIVVGTACKHEPSRYRAVRLKIQHESNGKRRSNIGLMELVKDGVLLALPLQMCQRKLGCWRRPWWSGRSSYQWLSGVGIDDGWVSIFSGSLVSTRRNSGPQVVFETQRNECRNPKQVKWIHDGYAPFKS
jgi:hypothetical protein